MSDNFQEQITNISNQTNKQKYRVSSIFNFSKLGPYNKNNLTLTKNEALKYYFLNEEDLEKLNYKLIKNTLHYKHSDIIKVAENKYGVNKLKEKIIELIKTDKMIPKFI